MAVNLSFVTDQISSQFCDRRACNPGFATPSGATHARGECDSQIPGSFIAAVKGAERQPNSRSRSRTGSRMILPEARDAEIGDTRLTMSLRRQFIDLTRHKIFVLVAHQ